MNGYIGTKAQAVRLDTYTKGQMDGLLQMLDDELDFAIIYPNGGTEASPANVATNSRYVEANPFPGHHFYCVAEILINGAWGTAGWIFSTTDLKGYGVAAGMSSSADDSQQWLIVQTGSGGISSISSASGASVSIVSGNVTSPTPCRIKVWKLKGAA